MLEKEELKLKQCWNTVEADIFRKIRSGIIQERTPPPQRDPRLRLQSKNT